MPSRLARSSSDRTRPVASSSNHARPRTTALISAGSHLEGWFCGASPGNTILVATPRRLKSTAAVNSIVLAPGASDTREGKSPLNSAPCRTLMTICLSSTMTCSTSSRTILARSSGARRRAAASGTAEQFPHLVAGHGRRTKSFEQPRRVGQRVDQDADHTIFDLPGGQPPVLSAIVCCRGDQGCRDVIAIAPAVVDRVGWREPFTLRVDQQAGQQARLGGLGVAAVGAGIGRELVANRGPGLLIDQRRMLARVEVTLMRNPTGVNRV